MRAHKGGGPGGGTPEPPVEQAEENPAKSTYPAVCSVTEPATVGNPYSACVHLAAPNGPQTFLYPHAVYDMDEAAGLLHVSARHLRKLHDDGAIPSLHHKAKPLTFWGEDLIGFLRSMSAAKGDTP